MTAPTAPRGRVLRVASVPTDHVYVRHLDAVGGPGAVCRLPDPTPLRSAPGTWWPPRVLDPAWIRDHAGQVDLVHVHFGYDAESPAALAEWTATLRILGIPLVVTVHDLRNPHHAEPDLHHAQLGVLLEAAAAVITLTPGAALEVRQRYGRTARVLPHPHVVDLERLRRPRPPHDGFVVGVHCKSLRAGMDPIPVVAALADALAPLRDAVLRLDVHTEVMTPGFERYDPVFAARLHDLASGCRLDLRVHDYFSDDELFDYLQSLDVSVLPYRHGTHSGWLEACHDLGTTVLAPDCGYYAEQRPVLTYRVGDPASLAQAVRLAHEDRPAWRATTVERVRERAALAQAHEDLYRSVLVAEEVECTS